MTTCNTDCIRNDGAWLLFTCKSGSWPLLECSLRWDRYDDLPGFLLRQIQRNKRQRKRLKMQHLVESVPEGAHVESRNTFQKHGGFQLLNFRLSIPDLNNISLEAKSYILLNPDPKPKPPNPCEVDGAV